MSRMSRDKKIDIERTRAAKTARLIAIEEMEAFLSVTLPNSTVGGWDESAPARDNVFFGFDSARKKMLIKLSKMREAMP